MTLKEYLSEKDRFASAAGVELLEIKEGYARARMLVQPKHLNGGGSRRPSGLRKTSE